jgi:hypothetical protein
LGTMLPQSALTTGAFGSQVSLEKMAQNCLLLENFWELNKERNDDMVYPTSGAAVCLMRRRLRFRQYYIEENYFLAVLAHFGPAARTWSFSARSSCICFIGVFFADA